MTSSSSVSSVNLESASTTASMLREFTHRMLDVVNLRPEGWPQVSPSEYGELRFQLRARIEALYDFIDNRPNGKKEEPVAIRLLGESAQNLLDLEWRRPASYLEASSTFLQLCEERPDPLLQYDQLYCTPDSTERRIHQVLQDIDKQDTRVLFMGDDDLGSIALSRHFDGEIHVFEFDERVLSHIREKAPQVQCHNVDLVLGGVPRSMKGAFDAVVLDPPWDNYHAWCFLHKALFCLRESPQARIYLSFCPLNAEHLEKKAHTFFHRFGQVGLTFESITPTFHLYPLQGTEFMELLLKHIPPMESPLLDVLKTLPFGYSNLYKLRHTEHFRGSRLRRWFSDWWHSKSDAEAPMLVSGSKQH